jgi:ATP-dependent Clp protease ATP-binding subunit ClpC
MYERFTDRARKVMQLANQEAQRFNHEYIGTEHILLGLVKEGAGVAANALKNLNIDLRKVRLEVEKIVQSGPDMLTMGKLPQTPRAKKVIEYSIEEARGLNHNYVGTEHLLLGLMREGDGVAAQVLAHLGLTTDRVRTKVMNSLGHPEPITPRFAGRAGRWVGRAVRKFLAKGPKPRDGSADLAGLPAGADRLAEIEARTRALERQLGNARFLLGGILGAGAGALVDERLGAVVGLLAGGGVALFGRLVPALLAGGIAGSYVASTHLGGEVATVAGAAGGALLAACVAEIGRPVRPVRVDGPPGNGDPTAAK